MTSTNSIELLVEVTPEFNKKHLLLNDYPKSKIVEKPQVDSVKVLVMIKFLKQMYKDWISKSSENSEWLKTWVSSTSGRDALVKDNSGPYTKQFTKRLSYHVQSRP